MPDREVIMDSAYLCDPDGVTVHAPDHCGQPMENIGDCERGCCDDYKCAVCGKEVRVEWPD